MSKPVRKGSKLNKRGGSNANRRDFNDDGSFWGEPDKGSSDSEPEIELKNKIVETANDRKKSIETANPNDAPTRNLKISELSIKDDANQPGNRKEREALEAARKKEAYFKLQMEGKTAQAKSDLARLAIIKKQREEAARKRAQEVEAKGRPSSAKESSMNAGRSIISKSLGNNK